MGAKPLQAVPGARQCAHPSRPSPLRRLVESAEDTCVELLVAEHNSHPCCLLPRAAAGTWGAQVCGRHGGAATLQYCQRCRMHHHNRRLPVLANRRQPRARCFCFVLFYCRLPNTIHSPVFRLPQTRGLLGLLSLETLDAGTLTNSLAAVEGQLSSTCASCPAVALESLRESPPLCAYLERCLELTRENPGLGPAPAVLLLQVRGAVLVRLVVQAKCGAPARGAYSQFVRLLHSCCILPGCPDAACQFETSRCTLGRLLPPATCASTLCSPPQIVSRLNYGANPAMREPFYRRFYLPLQVALEAAAELHAEAFTPQARLHWIAWLQSSLRLSAHLQ